MGAPDPENPLFLGFFVLREGLRPWSSDILFPLQPPPLPIPTNPPGHPTREGLISVHFGSVWLRSAPFGSVWLRFGSVPGPFRVRFGVLGGVVVGSVRGASVREENITTMVSDHGLGRAQTMG